MSMINEAMLILSLKAPNNYKIVAGIKQSGLQYIEYKDGYHYMAKQYPVDNLHIDKILAENGVYGSTKTAGLIERSKYFTKDWYNNKINILNEEVERLNYLINGYKEDMKNMKQPSKQYTF